MILNRSAALALTMSEFGMYLYMVWYLLNWDKRNHEKKIITASMRQARKEKNILTLKGQICTFITKAGLLIGALIVLWSGHQIFEKSVTPFSAITFSQILSSHELRRYVKSKFD